MTIEAIKIISRRCSDALEPSRELDWEIHVLVRPPSMRGRYFDCPRYTESLDAAASLIPDGFDWILERTNGGITISSRVGHNDPDRYSWGSTPTLALCVGALDAMVMKLEAEQ